MHVIVIGAGLIGVTCAWYLRRAGFEVSVLDRQPGPALETSFANGGQISVSHPEPWANPGAPGVVLRWLGRADAPLVFRLRADPQQWAFGLSFLRECLPARCHQNTTSIAHLALFSLQALKALRKEAGLVYPYKENGILHLFHHPQDAEKAPLHHAILKGLGIRSRLCTPAECFAIEPALAHSPRKPVVGLYGVDDESGDAHLFTRQLAQKAAEAGVRFHYGVHVQGFIREGARVAALQVQYEDEKGRKGPDTTVSAQSYVLCAGSYSPLLARQIGERLPIYPVKGYSLTVPVLDPEKAPQVSLTDEHRRIVCSRLGDRLRIAGTAELNGYELGLRPERAKMLEEWLKMNLPGAGDLERSLHWCGLRPATPSNVPIIRKSCALNLWYNTGHGTLGWTLACGSAALLCEQMTGQTPKLRGFG
jgi:D-amino-acid dehydrogenase